MSEGIDRYLRELRRALTGSDPATVQDALADAEDHLRTALTQARKAEPGRNETDLLATLVESYGSPEEVAESYRDTETRSTPPFARTITPEPANPMQRFFGVLGDPRAYGALLFLLFSIVTGILYFTWAVTGISLSAGLLVTILGLPFFGVFMVSIRGLALVEGRLIEAMLGIRMPKRHPRSPGGRGLWGKFTSLLADRQTWTTILYCILKLPLGVVSFTIFTVLLTYALELIALPVLSLLSRPFIVVSGTAFYVPTILLPLFVFAGILDLALVMHLARWMGRGYGRMAKTLLVRG